jgi:hypothetical protein
MIPVPVARLAVYKRGKVPQYSPKLPAFQPILKRSKLRLTVRSYGRQPDDAF